MWSTMSLQLPTAPAAGRRQGRRAARLWVAALRHLRSSRAHTTVTRKEAERLWLSDLPPSGRRGPKKDILGHWLLCERRRLKARKNPVLKEVFSKPDSTSSQMSGGPGNFLKTRE